MHSPEAKAANAISLDPASFTDDTRLYTSTIVAALGGLLFGLDTAVISGATAALHSRVLRPHPPIIPP